MKLIWIRFFFSLKNQQNIYLYVIKHKICGYVQKVTKHAKLCIKQFLYWECEYYETNLCQTRITIWHTFPTNMQMLKVPSLANYTYINTIFYTTIQ